MFGLILTSIPDAYIRRTFASAGLHAKTVALDADTTIRCWIPKSPPTKPLLLLIHGLGFEATWQWHRQVHPLSRHFNLVIPDLLFFGGSTTKSPDRSEDFQATCIARLLDTLYTGKSVSVVGTSYGGFVAYHLARMLGAERVERVVIASSDLLKTEEDDVAVRERAGVETIADLMIPRSTGHLRTLIGLSVHRSLWFLPECLLRDLVVKLSKDNLKEKMELIKGITISNKYQFQLSSLPQKVLIVWGEHDNLFPLMKAHEIKGRLGEESRLEIIKNTSHVPQMEDPYRFNEAVLCFLLAGHK